MRIKIKSYRTAEGKLHAATSKFFFRNGTDLRKNRGRALEPEEVIELPDKEALNLLELHGRYIEQTLDDVTRPLYYDSERAADESSNHSPGAPGRADKAREEMDELKTKMAEEAAKAEEEVREKIREEEREKIRAEMRAEMEAENVDPAAVETDGHTLPSEAEPQEEAPQAAEPQEEAPQGRRRRRSQ